jgi:Protein of unknown function (DUF1488)
MALTFPNRSRSYDEAGQHIRFLGYDGMFEISFLIETKALPNRATAEAGYLAAFDAARDSILDVARKAYSRGRKNLCVLTSGDFRHQASRRL